MRAATLFLLVIVLALPAASAQSPRDDQVIVPGVRIGKWTFAMTLDDLTRMNGPAAVSQVLDPEYRSAGFVFYGWSSLDFGAGTDRAHKVEWFAVGFTYAVIPWKTKQGIGLQNTRADVLKAYGKPSLETVPGPGLKNMIYDAIGIDFQVYESGGNIKEIRIFRPGTAKGIWKL